MRLHHLHGEDGGLRSFLRRRVTIEHDVSVLDFELGTVLLIVLLSFSYLLSL